MKHNRSTKVQNPCPSQYLGVLEQEMSVDTLQKRSVIVSALDRARVSVCIFNTPFSSQVSYEVPSPYYWCRTAVA